MFINNRVILKKATVKTDISVLCSDPYAGSQAIAVAHADDAIYIGSDLPFNHRFLMMTAKNQLAGELAVAVWNGSTFAACEDVQDFTATSGKPLNKNGL